MMRKRAHEVLHIVLTFLIPGAPGCPKVVRFRLFDQKVVCCVFSFFASPPIRCNPTNSHPTGAPLLVLQQWLLGARLFVARCWLQMQLMGNRHFLVFSQEALRPC